MNIKNMLKNFINGTDDNYIESDDATFEDDFDFAPSSATVEEPVEKAQPKTKFKTERASSNVVNIASSAGNLSTNSNCKSSIKDFLKILLHTPEFIM